jgi:predicted ATPase/class 3 adenylate cyclase/DNA-binding CsgD family transcriptional regulator
MRELPTGTVTLLFTDIEGSTRLLQQLGERYTSLLDVCRSLLRTAFFEFHGYEVDTQGDAFFVAFARATDAVAAAVAAQRALFTHAWPEGMTVRVRMGLHTGEPFLGAEGYVGLDVHRAARIMSAGHGGQVLLSQTTHDLVAHTLPEGVRLLDLGVHRLKDLQRPSQLFQLAIAGLPTDFPPLKTLDSSPNNLPIQPTSLIGREKEVAAVVALLCREDVRLVTLTGPGGTGKTRLGLQVAAELSDWFDDGVFFVNLAPLSDPELILPAIAEVLDVKEMAKYSLLSLLHGYLREKRLLLLLDNFEQVVRAALPVAELLAACPKLKVLVTSRMTLHVRAEQEFAVPPLALPDPKHLPDLVVLAQYEAVALFIQRARAVKSDFQVTNVTAPAIAEICVRLDGLPLAIELAAARIKLFPPPALLARLSQRLVVLTGGAQDAPARQQTLRDTIEWSYHLLDVGEQLLFRRLSAFVGGCTLEAVEEVCATLGDATAQLVDGVASLIDKSLLRQTEQEEEEPRLVMLETIREYGLEALTEHQEMETTCAAHAVYYLRLAEEADVWLWGPQLLAWLERLEREHDNLRAALAWSLEPVLGEEAGQRMEMALRLGGALHRFWFSHGHFSEGRTFLERALAASADVTTVSRAKALVVAADLAYEHGDAQQVEALAEESLALARAVGDELGIARALGQLGRLAGFTYESARARALLEESVALCQELGNHWYLGWSLLALASFADARQGELVKAQAHYEEALALWREIGDKEAVAIALTDFAGFLNDYQKDFITARSMSEEALMLSRGLSSKQEVHPLSLLSWIALNQGDLTAARQFAEETLALEREMGSKWSFANPLCVLARVEVRLGNYDRARYLYEDLLPLVKEVGDKGLTAIILEGLAEVLSAQGEVAWAARLWGAAESLRVSSGFPLLPVDLIDYEPAVAAARLRLSERAFDAAWDEGRTMTLDQVLGMPGRAIASTAVSAVQPATPSVKPSSSFPAGLTAREVEVLRLVAQGLTDAQVAARLVISPRTVKTHLTSIYNRLGVDSRTAATRAAIEHHLV